MEEVKLPNHLILIDSKYSHDDDGPLRVNYFTMIRSTDMSGLPTRERTSVMRSKRCVT